MRLDFDFGEGGSVPLWYITSRYAPNQPMTYLYWSNLRYLYVIGIVLVGAYNAVDNDSD